MDSVMNVSFHSASRAEVGVFLLHQVKVFMSDNDLQCNQHHRRRYDTRDRT